MTETFYDRLGVPAGATDEEIERAYREAIKETHPDVSDDRDASERTARLNEAKAVLTDERERARYDRLGHASYTSGVGAGTGSGRGGDERGSQSGVGRAGTDHGPGGERERPDGGRSTAGWRRGERGARGARGTGRSSSARRQAAASATPGPNPDGTWNAWHRTGTWAVHRETEPRDLYPNGLFPDRESLVAFAGAFVCYPLFVFGAVVPAVPLLVRLLAVVCVLLAVAYVLSIPGAAVLFFGLWSLLLPFVFLSFPDVSLVSPAGAVGLLSTWLPFGFALLVSAVFRPFG